MTQMARNLTDAFDGFLRTPVRYVLMDRDTKFTAEFLASLVAGDDHVYAISTDGTMFVLAANAEESQPVVNRLDEPCSASPALANGSLFVRGAWHLYCIGGRD
jgi:hypothetical protein